MIPVAHSVRESLTGVTVARFVVAVGLVGDYVVVYRLLCTLFCDAFWAPLGYTCNGPTRQCNPVAYLVRPSLGSGEKETALPSPDPGLSRTGWGGGQTIRHTISLLHMGNST